MAKATVSAFSSLGEARARYLAEVDKLAEAARVRHITAGSGQAMTYDAKHAEAQRYPDSGPFPWLEGEAEALGVTVQAVADSVLAAREQWQAVGIAIESARLKAKKAIRNAPSAADMCRITEVFKAQL